MFSRIFLCALVLFFFSISAMEGGEDSQRLLNVPIKNGFKFINRREEPIFVYAPHELVYRDIENIRALNLKLEESEINPGEYCGFFGNYDALKQFAKEHSNYIVLRVDEYGDWMEIITPEIQKLGYNGNPDLQYDLEAIKRKLSGGNFPQGLKMLPKISSFNIAEVYDLW